MNKSLLVEFLLKYTLLEVILFNIYRNKNLSINNISSFVLMLAFYCWKPVTYTKANFKKSLATSKMVCPNLDAYFIRAS